MFKAVFAPQFHENDTQFIKGLRIFFHAMHVAGIVALFVMSMHKALWMAAFMLANGASYTEAALMMLLGG